MAPNLDVKTLLILFLVALLAAVVSGISNSDVTLNPISVVTGDTPNFIQWDFDLTVDLLPGETITITAGGAANGIFAAAGITSCTFSQAGTDVTTTYFDGNGATPTPFKAQEATGETGIYNELVITTSSTKAQTVAAASGSISVSCGTNLNAFGSAGESVAFTIASSSTSGGSEASIVGWTVTPAASVGDPLTFTPDGEKIKFWLPDELNYPLLRTPDLHVLAKVFQGPSLDYQWFESFMFTTPQGAVVAETVVKRNASDLEGGFHQIDVYVASQKQMKLLETLPSRGELSFGVTTPAGAVKIQVGRRHHTPRTGGSALTEYVHVETDTLSFLVEASRAGTEFPDDFEKQLKYAHLDMFVLQMRNKASFTGILPQLWGLQPRTPEVQSMLIAPSEKLRQKACSEGTDAVCPATQ